MLAAIGIVLLVITAAAFLGNLLVDQEAQRRFLRRLLARAKALRADEKTTATDTILFVLKDGYDAVLGPPLLSRQSLGRSLVVATALVLVGCAIAGAMTGTTLGFERPPWAWLSHSASTLAEFSYRRECSVASEANPAPNCDVNSSDEEIRQRLFFEREAALVKPFDTRVWRLAHTAILFVLITLILFLLHGGSTALTRKIISDGAGIRRSMLVFSALNAKLYFLFVDVVRC